MTYDDQLNIRVSKEVKKAFIQKAKENHTSATELLVRYMEEYLGLKKAGLSEAKAEIAELKLRIERQENEFSARISKLEQVAMGELAA
jgi:hypothetical protein